jgi:heat shock protein HslJ
VTVLLPAAVGLLTVALLMACSQTVEPTGPAPLAGSSWILTGVAIDGVVRPSLDDSASLTFAPDGRLAGSTGCNRFTGTWSQEANRLTLTPGATTLMACSDESGRQETAVLAALDATDRYRSDGRTLVLLDPAGAVLAQYRPAPVELTGTDWRATGVNNGRGGVVSTTGTEELSLAFGSDGTATGFDGCGRFTGRFTTEGARISIEALSAARCGDARQESYLAALQHATTWRVDGNRLELRDDAGALQVGLVQA